MVTFPKTILKLGWTVYCQQLRDITTQPGFPWDITWPTTPPTN